jgi:hypothetical protein
MNPQKAPIIEAKENIETDVEADVPEDFFPFPIIDERDHRYEWSVIVEPDFRKGAENTRFGRQA